MPSTTAHTTEHGGNGRCKASNPALKGSFDMARIDVDKMSLKELVELEGRVQKAITTAKERERVELKSRMAAMAESSGFSMEELFGNRRGARGKVAGAKFVNPDNRSETWTGRGRKPNWLVAKLSKGASMDDFAV
jgi:DNA-binding protein H-NS